ncbi:hypothetical protein [Devosia sp.]|uniref:hypothetical protein n=1 Tax=Devosia sp. TaxID=1871048 RepID=UPI0019D82C94|nr:hypothetical protein [Devosia sp.]MBE0579993.1 hypothetical protein [Devosia sp.]
MAGKDELLDSVPTMRRRPATSMRPQGQPASPPREAAQSSEPNAGDVIEEAPPTRTYPAANIKKGSLFDLKAAERPNSKGAVNLLLAPELKARLDAANYASKVPRVQIVIAALDEYLEKNGF